MLKLIGKSLIAGIKTSGKAATALRGVGGEAAEGLAKNWGVKSGKIIAEEQAKHVDELARTQAKTIIKKLDKGLHSGFGGDVATKLDNAFSKAKVKLNGELDVMRQKLDDLPGIKNKLKGATDRAKQVDAEIKELKQKLDHVKKVVPIEDPKRDTVIRGIIGDSEAGAKKTLRDLSGELNSINSQIDELSGAVSSANKIEKKMVHMRKIRDSIDQGDYKNVAQKLFGSGEQQEFTTGMLGGDLSNELQNLTRQVIRSNSFKSPSINNPKKFLEEYLNYELKAPHLAEAFRSNPANMEVLAKINARNPGLIEKLVKDKVVQTPPWQSLAGLTYEQLGKRLGIGAVAATASTVAYGVSVYDWFGKNDPEHVATEATGIRGMLSRLNANDKAKPIIASVDSALGNISYLAKEANDKLSDREKAPEAVKKYVNGLATYGSEIVESLREWSVVEANCEDPMFARDIAETLLRFLDSLGKNIDSLGSSLSSEIKSAPSGEAGSSKGPVNKNNLSKIQSFLGLTETGELDSNTIGALRQLENQYNARAGTNEFTGAFIVPETGRVISYDKLLKAQEIIKRY